MAHDIVQEDLAQEPRMGALELLGNIACLGISAVTAIVLAGWFGIVLGNDILNGMPGDELQPRVLSAAMLFIPAVVLIILHWKPVSHAGRPVWWNSPAAAAGSLIWLLGCQAIFASFR